MKKIIALGITLLFLTVSISSVIATNDMNITPKTTIEPILYKNRNLGDLDYDTDVDSVDYSIFRATFGLTDALYGDFNGDGVLDDDDLDILKSLQGTEGESEGDLDNNGVVNSFDRLTWNRYQANPKLVHPNFNSNADYDGDGIITFVDYQIWLGYYNKYNADLVKPSLSLSE